MVPHKWENLHSNDRKHTHTQSHASTGGCKTGVSTRKGEEVAMACDAYKTYEILTSLDVRRVAHKFPFPSLRSNSTNGTIKGGRVEASERGSLDLCNGLHKEERERERESDSATATAPIHSRARAGTAGRRAAAHVIRKSDARSPPFFIPPVIGKGRGGSYSASHQPERDGKERWERMIERKERVRSPTKEQHEAHNTMQLAIASVCTPTNARVCAPHRVRTVTHTQAHTKPG